MKSSPFTPYSQLSAQKKFVEVIKGQLQSQVKETNVFMMSSEDFHVRRLINDVSLMKVAYRLIIPDAKEIESWYTDYSDGGLDLWLHRHTFVQLMLDDQYNSKRALDAARDHFERAGIFSLGCKVSDFAAIIDHHQFTDTPIDYIYDALLEAAGSLRDYFGIKLQNRVIKAGSPDLHGIILRFSDYCDYCVGKSENGFQMPFK